MASTSDWFIAHLVNVKNKKRKRVELTSQLAAIEEASINDVDPSQVESVMCVKHGLYVTAQLQLALIGVPPITTKSDRDTLLDVIFKGLGLEYSAAEQNLIAKGLIKENVTAAKEAFVFLFPPVQTCIKCNDRLVCHNKPSEVTLYNLNGASKALNI